MISLQDRRDECRDSIDGEVVGFKEDMKNKNWNIIVI